MTEVNCSRKHCKYIKNYRCTKDSILIEKDSGCYNFADYTDEDYDNEFWIACKDVDGKAHRHMKKGKGIKKYGLWFFTESDDRYKADCHLTELTTGHYVGTLADLTKAKSSEEIKAKLAEFPDVMTLPEYDANGNNALPVDKGGN